MTFSSSSTFFAALVLLSVGASCNCASHAEQAACELLVDEILQIQEVRKTKMKQINQVLSSYGEGNMDRPLMLERSRQWREAEADLRSQVSQLYSKARRADCL